jgi:hypothetical protein
MEQARLYQASLEAMYINDHQQVGSLIHPDHHSNIQTLLTVSVLREHPGRWTCREQVEWYRFKNSNSVRASSLHHLLLCHRLRPTPPPDNRSDNANADAEGVEAMPIADSPPPLPAVQVGRGGGGAANLAPAWPSPAALPKPVGRGKGKRI